MALIKLGGLVIGISGSIAGNTFARNRSGAYVRARTTPINPNTALQQAVRAALAFLTDRWAQTLTAGQRTAWNLYASSVTMKNKLGESILLTGFNHYIRSNAARKQHGAGIIDNGPTIFEIPAKDPTFAITASAATQMISFTFDITMDWAVEAGSYLHLFQGRPQNAQRNFFDGPWRKVGIHAGEDPGPLVSPIDRLAVFTISEGQRLWTYARISRADGRLSEVFRADTFCAA